VKKLLVILLLAGGGVAGWMHWQKRQQPPQLTEAKLTLAPMQQGTMRDVVSATAIVHTNDIVLVGSEMPGTVVRLHARVNQVVSDGALLAELDDRRVRLKVEEADNGLRLAQAAVAQAQAMRDAADIALQVQTELQNKGGFRSDRDQADMQAKAAQAGLLAAEAKAKAAETARKEAYLALDMSKIKVPTSSVPGKREYLVLERKVSEGQAVGPQAGPLFVLSGDLHRVEVHSQIGEGDVAKVRKGLTARFTVTTYSEEEVEFVGVVREIRPLANNLKGQVFYDAIIEVENQKDPASGEWRLRPGMTMSLDVVRREHKNAWKVPSTALNFRLDDAFIAPAAKARIEEWRKRADADQWFTLWTWDAAKQTPWPLFVRVGGTDRNGEPGLKDTEGNEVLEWEPGSEPALGKTPRLIIGTPPARAPGFFDQPTNIKVS
jgi:macrolide-specific efflux system membrane fusion protein